MSNGAVPGEVQPAAPAPPAAAPDWRESLSADLRGDAHVVANPSLENFAKTAIHAQHQLGKTGIRQPGENATVQDVAAFYGQLGRPDNVDKYVAADFKDVEWKEGVARNEEFEGALLQELFDAGNNPYQAGRAYAKYAELTHQLAAQADEARNDSEQEFNKQISETWGMAKEAKLAAAKEAWKHILGSEEAAAKWGNMKLEDGTLLGEHMDWIAGFAELGQHLDKTGDGKTFVGGKQPSFTKTPEQASEDLAAFRANEEKMKAWTTKGHMGHEAAQVEFTRLFKAANGGA